MKKITSEEWNNAKCDKTGYLIAVGCGAVGGLVDVFLAGSPDDSKLLKFTDEQAEKAVRSFSKKCGWSPREGKENSTASAMGHLEKMFKINYDQVKTPEVNELFKMVPNNHHMKSLGHSPDIFGLFFSVLDQFRETSTFVSDGKVFTINTESFELQGNTVISKFFAGFSNWFGHLMSDFAGSSGSVRRGTGIVMPFYELFGLCDFGSFKIGREKQDLATLATRAFQEGYDARFGMTMSIPILITNLAIRLIWAIRQKFQFQKEIRECIPTDIHSDLRVMLLIGNSALCLIDGTDAVIAGIRSKNCLIAFCHLNLVGWVRLTTAVVEEVIIRLGIKINESDPLLEKIFGAIPEEDRKKLLSIVATIKEYATYTATYQAMKSSLEELELAKDERVRIEAECKAKISLLQKMRLEMTESVENYLLNYMTAFSEGFSLIEEGIVMGNAELFLGGNSVIQNGLGYDSQFGNQSEFDALMGSEAVLKF